jgi:hypothetical protein
MDESQKSQPSSSKAPKRLQMSESNLTLKEIEQELKKMKIVAIFWHIDDVWFYREDLTDEQAWHVLEECANAHEVQDLMSAEFIQETAEELYPLEQDQ